MIEYDVATGRPLEDGDEAVETLADDLLDAEITVALLDPERREQRFERLAQELLNRRRESVATSH